MLGPNPTLSDWSTDWLYALVFKEIDAWCHCLDSDPDCFSLIEERNDDNGSYCTGAVIRAWVCNRHGMTEISVHEALAHEALARENRRRYEYESSYNCLALFHIRPGRDYVVYGWYSPFHVGGSGGRYVVVGQMENAVLKYDGGGWIS